MIWNVLCRKIIGDLISKLLKNMTPVPMKSTEENLTFFDSMGTLSKRDYGK